MFAAAPALRADDHDCQRRIVRADHKLDQAVARIAELLQTQKRFDEAVRVFTLATEVAGERAGAFYYLAWAYGAKGDKKKSLKALQTAVDKGFSDAAALESNKGFDSVRDDPQYQKIISALKIRP
jgi:tetratricopeptide (TPR) repeat protein